TGLDLHVGGLRDVHLIADELQRAELIARLAEGDVARASLEERIAGDHDVAAVTDAAQGRGGRQVAGGDRRRRVVTEHQGRVTEDREGHVLGIEDNARRAREVRGRIVDGDVTVGRGERDHARARAAGDAADDDAAQAGVDDVTVDRGRGEVAGRTRRHDHLAEVHRATFGDRDVGAGAGGREGDRAEVIRTRERDVGRTDERAQSEDIERARLGDVAGAALGDRQRI